MRRPWSSSGGVGLHGTVAVVTAASSGIDRALALGLAEHGADVVLAARSGADLDEVAAACERAGRRALVVPTDVSAPEQVHELARRTVGTFGGFDVWVNGAAVMAYGAFDEIPAEAFRQVVETTLFGTVHGCREALAHFRGRGRGILINIDSVYGRITSPYVSPYVASKFAVRGLIKCLRQETIDHPGIAVCAVLPQAVDTPIFRHAANYTGREVTALPGIADPDRVVRAILRCIERPRAEVYVGALGRLLILGELLFPRAYEAAAPRLMERVVVGESAAPASDGNVFGPEPQLNQVGGGWRRQRRTPRRAALGAAVAASAVPLGLAWWRVRQATDRGGASAAP